MGLVKRAPLTSRQFCVWTVCVTLGFVCWLFLDPVWTFLGMLFFFGAFSVLVSRKEWLAPASRNQVVGIFLSIGVVALAIVGQKLWWPGLNERGLENWVRNPVIVIPFWGLLVGLKFLLWKRCRATCPQNLTGSGTNL